MKKQRVVLVSGNFNVLHPGHLRLLRFAKECGDRLVVAVLSDRITGSSSHVPELLRLEGVQSNLWVDEAFIVDEPIETLVRRLRPDLVVKGKEHERGPNPEIAELEAYGGRLLFGSGEIAFSSLDLIRKEFLSIDSRSIRLPDDFLYRHGIKMSSLHEISENFSRLKVCVVGDLIIDEYITCEPLGMSQEDPTIVVTPVDSAKFVGGAGIVAAHAACLMADVTFISVSGADNARSYALDCFDEWKVSRRLLEDSSRPTTLKQRYRSKGKTLFRVSHLRQAPISLELQQEFVQLVEEEMEDADLLVFSDFNYGCLPQSLLDRIVSMGKSRGIFMAADSQSSSQIGDISRFQGMDLITPTEREARISLRNNEDGLVVLAERLRKKADAKNVFITLGEEGLLIHPDERNRDGWITDRVDALNSVPKDVAGAGDSLLIVSAMAMASGASVWEAACLGSIAAGIQVGRVGNNPIQLREFLPELAHLNTLTVS
jgi:rfaE bifunctional protein kinase chain/domain